MAVEPVHNNRILSPVSLAFAVTLLALAGCPRFASVIVFNNTEVSLTVEGAGNRYTVGPEGSIEFRFGGEGLLVTSDLGRWRYERKIPHGGADGPFFDGTLRLQIQSDGAAYAVPVGKMAPIVLPTNQPEGYPLRPI